MTSEVKFTQEQAADMYEALKGIVESFNESSDVFEIMGAQKIARYNAAVVALAKVQS